VLLRGCCGRVRTGRQKSAVGFPSILHRDPAGGSACARRFFPLSRRQPVASSRRDQGVKAGKKLVCTQISLQHGVRAQLLRHACTRGARERTRVQLFYKGSLGCSLTWENHPGRAGQETPNASLCGRDGGWAYVRVFSP